MEPNIPVGSEAGVASRHEARGRRRRARAARRRQRQVGRALEDGPHRPAGVGEGRRRTTSSAAQFPPLTYTPADADGSVAARAGAAHRARRPRPAQRRAAVRQRLRPGLAGGGAQAGRLLRQRRRPLSDGRHGDRRDPPQHPVGMAAQGRGASPRTMRRPASRPATRSRASCSSGCSPRNTTSCWRAGNRDVHDDSKTTTLPIAREIVDDLRHRARSSCRGTSTC